MLATALNEIFAARKALAACLINSALFVLVTSRGADPDGAYDAPPGKYFWSPV